MSQKLIGCIWKILRKSSIMEFILVKLQGHSVQTAKSTISRLQSLLFSEYVPKISYFKRNILRKKYIVYQLFNKIARSSKSYQKRSSR